ncbi:MAG: orotidine-5'-phosphate decarboxylase [Paracoccaceae bacterium]|jgi:orotidine-5'-phosphate decarboxylase
MEKALFALLRVHNTKEFFADHKHHDIDNICAPAMLFADLMAEDASPMSGVAHGQEVEQALDHSGGALSNFGPVPLQRVPAPFAADHPQGDLLNRK